MEAEIIQFPGKYNTREAKAGDICKDISMLIANRLRDKYNFDISKPQFMTNMAWLIKFIDVLICDEIGLANELSRELKRNNLE